MSHRFDPVILREYDIRGTVGKNLNPDDAHALGRAFGTMARRAGGRKIAIGYDGRTHSPKLEAALVEGLTSTGINVVRVGRGPTPMLYFATKHLGADGGMMVTGSHNPPNQNGFKMLLSRDLKNGGPVYGDKIKALAVLAEKDDFENGAGKAESADVQDAYVAHLLAAHKSPRGFKIAWDCGNGASGEIVRRLTSKLPGKHILLFDTIDGTFPNHKPDPSDAKNLKDLQDTVLKNECDLGIAFDGDADRIGAVDGKARVVAGDQLLAIYAHDVLKEHPGSAVIADVKASLVLFEEIEKLGGKPLMWKTGNSLIKAKMAETGAPLAGEMSGHIFFGDNFGFDDGIYAAMKLLSLLGNSGKSLADWRDSLPSTFITPEYRFHVDEAGKFAVVDEIKARLKKEGARMSEIDGVRVTTLDGWWLLRASNTEALLAARAESKTEAGLLRLKDALEGQLKASGLGLPKD